MNFQQLEYILAVHQCGNFAQAADRCNVTQATLSAMLKKLEQELNTMLFDRSRQPVRATEDGLRAVDLAAKIITQRNALLELHTEENSILTGDITLGIIPTIASSLLPLILPHMLKNHPGLRLHIHEITTEEIIQQLRKGKIDMGILATPLQHDAFLENILYYEAMMVYGVNESNKKFITPETLQDQKIWLLEEGNCFRNQSLTICNIREKAALPDNLFFQSSSFDTLLNLTDRFGGYTLIPELYYNLLPAERQQKTARFERPLPVREVSLIYLHPYAKIRSVELLGEQITTLANSLLTTSQYKASDLSIIGI
jgi:LysR family hydrogen peroxide-inducible transcriptional activator